MAWTPFLANLLVATAALAVLSSRTRPGILALAGQGLSLAALAVAVDPHVDGVVTAFLVLLAKGILVPGLLHRTAERTAAFTLVEALTPWRYLGVMGVLLAVRQLTPHLGGDAFGPQTAALVTASLATVMLGLLAVATRRLLPNQMLGLALTENGLYGAGLALAHGLPLLLDMGVAVDLLFALLLLAWLTGPIREAWGHIDVDRLNRLRG